MSAAVHTMVRKSALQPWRDAALVFLVVLCAALFGILTRPIGFLAAVWPANAILLALLVRNPALSAPLSWAGAFLGYLAADLLTGGGLAATLWLTAANMAGVAAGFFLFMRADPEDRRLRRPASIVVMFGICAIMAAASGVVGSGAARIVLGRDMATGFAFWFTTELVNAVIVLPVILAAPAPARWRPALRRRAARSGPRPDCRPVLTLVAATAAGILVGGPGAFAYPVPALLWCALSYGLFGTAFLTMILAVTQLIAASAGIIPAFPPSGEMMMMTVSIRLAVAMIALGPLAVASINDARNEVLRRLRHAADHDSLTGALSRGTFIRRGAEMLAAAGEPRAIAAFMLDIDHFKSVNDRHGHATGDRVLRETARAVAATLRDGDLFGRLGGEEFAIVCAAGSDREAAAIAERLRRSVEAVSIRLPCETPLRVTISIGVAVAGDRTSGSLDTLLATADTALYEAKIGGRNRVAVAAPPLFDEPAPVLHTL